MGWVRSSLSEVRRMRQRVSGGGFTIRLADGGHARFSRDAVGEELYLWFANTLRATYHKEPRPEPPALILSILGAEDRETAFAVAFPKGPPTLPVDPVALRERGELVPRPLVTSEVVG
jgi:hypothetical protein